MVALLATTGCIVMGNKSAAKSWPEPTSAPDLKSFGGMFHNRSVDRTTGKPGEGSQLFDFFTGRSHWRVRQGTGVEVRSSEDGASLFIRLLDEKGAEMDSVTLRRDADFKFEDGSLRLFGPFSGTHPVSGNLGTGVQHESARLHVSSQDGFLGQRSESGVGFMFYFVPFASSSRRWMFWPKLATQE